MPWENPDCITLIKQSSLIHSKHAENVCYVYQALYQPLEMSQVIPFNFLKIICVCVGCRGWGWEEGCWGEPYKQKIVMHKIIYIL